MELTSQGFNITIGGEVFIGANCTLLDVCPNEFLFVPRLPYRDMI